MNNPKTNLGPEVEINFGSGEGLDNENDGAGISLPDEEKVKTDLTPRRQFPYRLIVVAVCVLAIVIGVSVGLSGKSISPNSKVDSTGPAKTEDPVDKTSGGNVIDGNGDKLSNGKEGNIDTGNEVSNDPADDKTGFNGNGSVDRYNDVLNFLKEVSSEEKLNEKGSPANLACNWISNSDTLQLPVPQNTTSADSHVFIQRYVSALLYFSLDGDTWMFHDDFLKGNDVCSWNRVIHTDDTSYIFGLSCENSTFISRIFMSKLIWKCRWSYTKKPNVFFFSLAANNLTGTLPSEIGLLTSLTHISLFNNWISGSIPSTFDSLTGLTFFAIENNNITSTIPDWIGKWTNLKYLALGSNLLEGKLPDSLFSLTNLVEISLSNNELTGKLDDFADMPRLHRLFVGGNPFENEMDENFLAGSKIKQLDLGNTKLKGKIPTHFFSAESNFEIIDLHGNVIEGTLPDFEDNERLLFLSLYNNKISGNIPVSISNLSQLKHLDLSKNAFNGTIPEEITKLSGLTYLYLSMNHFTPEKLLPVWNLSNLKELSMEENNLKGSIPTEIGFLTNLVLLDLTHNQLTGKIPHAIGEISNLRFIMLNENLLTGTLSTGFKNLKNIGKYQ
jgi:Leucine-rich repeat (LRR) protein